MSVKELLDEDNELELFSKLLTAINEQSGGELKECELVSCNIPSVWLRELALELSSELLDETI